MSCNFCGMEHPLRVRRIAANLRVEALAAKVGVTKSTISRIETWQADPSLSLIRMLCEELPGLSANDFVGAPATPQAVE